MFYEQQNQSEQRGHRAHSQSGSHAEAESVESSAPLIAGFLAYAAAFPVAMGVAAACAMALN